MVRKPDPDERRRPLEPHDNGDFRDMRDEWKLRKVVLRFIKTFGLWTVGAIIAVAAVREQILSILGLIAGLFGVKP